MAPPVVDALEGLLAGQEDVGEWQANIHGTLAVGHTVGLELTHLLRVGGDHHLNPRPKRGEKREGRGEKGERRSEREKIERRKREITRAREEKEGDKEIEKRKREKKRDKEII